MSLTAAIFAVMIIVALWRIEKLLESILAELRWGRVASQFHPEENRGPTH